MTGELCDCYPSKREGVAAILAAVADVFPFRDVCVWGTDGRFRTLDEAGRVALVVAAANWHAQAAFAGRLVRDGHAALIDCGSTSTDVISLHDGKPTAKGFTDPERLKSGELVYTGSRRTPICALGLPDLAAELFATSLDAYLTLGMIDGDAEDRDTADGRPATKEFARIRLARMLGGDGELTPQEATDSLALAAFGRQRALIADGIRRAAPGATVAVVSGSGEFLARAAWRDVGGEQVVSLAERIGVEASAAACAYALAVMARDVG